MHTNTSTVVLARSVWRERRKKAGYDLVHKVRYRERSLLRVYDSYEYSYAGQTGGRASTGAQDTKYYSSTS